MLADHSTCSTPRDPEALAQRHHGARRFAIRGFPRQLLEQRLFELGLGQVLLQADFLALQLFQALAIAGPSAVVVGAPAPSGATSAR